MASDIGFVEFVCEQAQAVPGVSYKKMFGEYGIYVGSKMIGVICDNQLFVKPTTAGRALFTNASEAPPYAGAKPYLVVGEEIDDREFIERLFLVTEQELPAPKPKKPKKQ
jgi:TfoX/Sxy family transcriptional regulator of competence genes